MEWFSFSLLMESLIKDNNLTVEDMDGDDKHLTMAAIIKVCGTMTLRMAKAYLFSQTDPDMKANLKIKNLMGKVNSPLLTKPLNIKDSSKMTFLMGMELKLNLGSINIQDILLIDLSMEKDKLYLIMEQSIKDHGNTINLMEKDI